MKCRSCGAENPDEFKFCENCGESLGEISCPNCGHSNLREMKFCEECGSRLDVLVCPACSHENPLGFNFCEECGEKFAVTTSIPKSPQPLPELLKIRVVPIKKKKKQSVIPFLFKTALRSLAGSALGFLAGKVGVWAMNFLFAAFQ